MKAKNNYGPNSLKDSSPKKHGPMKGSPLNQSQYNPDNLKQGGFKVKTHPKQ